MGNSILSISTILQNNGYYKGQLQISHKGKYNGYLEVIASIQCNNNNNINSNIYTNQNIINNIDSAPSINLYGSSNFNNVPLNYTTSINAMPIATNYIDPNYNMNNNSINLSNNNFNNTNNNSNQNFNTYNNINNNDYVNFNANTNLNSKLENNYGNINYQNSNNNNNFNNVNYSNNSGNFNLNNNTSGYSNNIQNINGNNSNSNFNNNGFCPNNQTNNLISNNNSNNFGYNPNLDVNSSKESKWEKSLFYHKNSLFLQSETSNIYFFDFTNNKWCLFNGKTSSIFNKYVRYTELPDNSFLITGGDKDGFAQPSVYHFKDGNFISKANMNIGRKAHTTVYLNGFVYVFGGFGDSGVISACEKYDMNNGGWKMLSNMKYNLSYTTAVKYGTDLIYLFGGFGDIDNQGVTLF